MLPPITPEPLSFTPATRRVEAACAERGRPDAARRPEVIHDTYEYEYDRPLARPYWRYLEAQNRMDYAEVRRSSPLEGSAAVSPPAMIRPASLGSAKIGDVSPVRPTPSPSYVRAYRTERGGVHSGRIDILA